MSFDVDMKEFVDLQHENNRLTARVAALEIAIRVKLTTYQRMVLLDLSRGVRPQSRHASQAIGVLFRRGLLTDVDPADNRTAIGGRYLTPAGRVWLEAEVRR